MRLYVKVWMATLAVSGALIYDCSSEEPFDGKEVRSLAKRAMQTRGEEGLAPSSGTEKIRAGSWDEVVSTPHGKVSLRVYWTGGYTSGTHAMGETANVSGFVYQADSTILNPTVLGLTWQGCHHIGGDLNYNHVSWETVAGAGGVCERRKVVLHDQRFVFHLSNPVEFEG